MCSSPADHIDDTLISFSLYQFVAHFNRCYLKDEEPPKNTIFWLESWVCSRFRFWKALPLHQQQIESNLLTQQSIYIITSYINIQQTNLRTHISLYVFHILTEPKNSHIHRIIAPPRDDSVLQFVFVCKFHEHFILGGRYHHDLLFEVNWIGH